MIVSPVSPPKCDILYSYKFVKKPPRGRLFCLQDRAEVAHWVHSSEIMSFSPILATKL